MYKYLNRASHSVSLLQTHLVFVTKYRRKVFYKSHITAMRSVFRRVCIDLGATLVEYNGESDHVHLLVRYPVTVSISKLVQHLKGTSSREMRLRYSYLRKRYWKNVLWSAGYFSCSCGGASIARLKNYIKNQNTPTD